MGLISLSAWWLDVVAQGSSCNAFTQPVGFGTHIIQAFPTFLTSKTFVIAKSEGSFRTDFLPHARAIEHTNFFSNEILKEIWQNQLCTLPKKVFKEDM